MIKMMQIGRLGKDAVVKEVSGKEVINFSIATTEKWGSGDQKKEKTYWTECAYWVDKGKSKIAEYLKKGGLVYVEGTPIADAYLDKENKAASTLRLTVFSIKLLGSKDNEGASSEGASQRAAPATSGGEVNDDLPF